MQLIRTKSACKQNKLFSGATERQTFLESFQKMIQISKDKQISTPFKEHISELQQLSTQTICNATLLTTATSLT